MVELVITYGVDGKGLAARVVGQTAREFTRSIPWRVSMFLARASLDYVTEDELVFDEGLSYQQCKDVVESLSAGEDYGVSLSLDDSYTSYIDATQTFIRERSRVGMAIKHNDESIQASLGTFKQVVDAAMIRKLRPKQMLDAFFMASMRWAANFSVPGSGKTASVLGAYSFLHNTGKVNRVVVICPKSAFESWRGEWVACFGNRMPLRCFSLGDREVQRLTKAQRKRAIQFDSGRYNLLMLNYEALGSYVSEVAALAAEDTLLVYDEVHRVKGIDGQRATWALAVARRANYVDVLTGTPIPNTYRDIYNFLHILYPRDYDTFFGYEPGFLSSPTSFEIQDINEAIRPFFCRTNKDELGVPRPNQDIVLPLNSSDAESRLMHILRAAYRKNPLALVIRTLQLASDASMLAEALDPEDFEYVLDQVGEEIDDIDFVDYSSEVPGLIASCGMSTKMRACIEYVAALVRAGKPVIVWCIFVRSITKITKALNQLGIRACMIRGATPLDERERILEEFRMGFFPVLVTNPHTMAESVSLHQVCHDGVYFEYSYNLVHLLQSKDRIHRLGLAPTQYTQYHFFQTWFSLNDEWSLDHEDWSLDQKIYQRLLEKEQTMLEAIDGDYLECGYVDENDLEIVLGDLLEGAG